jgi:hypothetical protein
MNLGWNIHEKDIGIMTYEDTVDSVGQQWWDKCTY